MDSPVNQFLESGGFLVFGNSGAVHNLNLADHCLFQTSGSEAAPKFVALSRDALLNSAESVNRYFSVTRHDRWLRAIPDHHVGGFGIHARAFVAGCEVDAIDGRWDPMTFREEAGRRRTTLTSLVPTQIFDLVHSQLKAPPSLRLVIVGGGALETDLAGRAIELGWPLVATYGMTETGSMMAVAGEVRSPAGEIFRPLEGWDVRGSSDGLLELRGASLFSGYVREIGSEWSLQDPKRADGWFTSSDKVGFEGDGFVFRGRASDEVKVLGELVDLAKIQARTTTVAEERGLAGRNFLVVAVPHPRMGNELVLADATGMGIGEEFLVELNRDVPGFERVTRSVAIEEIPCSPLGKPLWRKLAEMLG